MEESINLEPLSNIVISDYRENEATDFHSNTADFLQNCQLNEDISGLNYCKVGGLYFISGSVDFTTTNIDILPEPSKADGFMSTSTGEIVLLTEGSTEMVAPTIGIKILSGFYAAEEQEH